MGQIDSTSKIDDGRKFIVCKAAAGSGKTFQLVAVFLTLAFSVDAKDQRSRDAELKKKFGRILAITFTNKAANEMKVRIMDELQAMKDYKAGMKMPAMVERLETTTGLAAAEICDRARVVHSAILHNYTDLSVCTIDSFVKRVATSFARELGLPMNFEVELDGKLIAKRVADELMAQIGTTGAEELTDLMVRYSNENMADGKSYNFDKDVQDAAMMLFDEDTQTFMQQLDEDLTTKDFIQIRGTVTDKRDSEKEAIMKIAQKIVDEAGPLEPMFKGGKNGPLLYFRKVAKWQLKYGKMEDPNKTAADFLNGGEAASATAKKEGREAEMRDWQTRMIDSYGKIQDHLKKHNGYKMLQVHIYKVALLQRLQDILWEYYEENGTVHISESNKKIAEVIKEAGDAPFVYERIGNQFDHLLIDEFQDTSKMQWTNLVPLIENGISEKHASLVVGDGKQAIYRFRHGDVRQFSRLPEIEGKSFNTLKEEDVYTPFPLQTNWRSRPLVVKFNNMFFRKAIDTSPWGDFDELRKIYRGSGVEAGDKRYDLEQTPNEKPGKQQGYVKVVEYPVRPKKEKDEKKDKAPNTTMLMLKDIVAEIKRQKDELHFEYGDICVLARNNRTLSRLAELLTAEGIQIVSRESLKVENSGVCNLVIAIMRYLQNPNDQQIKIEVLSRMDQLGRLKKRDRAEYEIDRQLKLEEIMQSEGYILNPNLLRAMPIYDCCEELFRMFKEDGTDDAYAGALLNKVLAYTQNQRQDLKEFLDWVDDNYSKLFISTTENKDAVKLMTIHTAKGLQSPIVMVALPVEKNPESTMWMDVPEEVGIKMKVGLITGGANSIFESQKEAEDRMTMMDRLNLLYVALTRPEEKLFIYNILKSEPTTTEDISGLIDSIITQSAADRVLGCRQLAGIEREEGEPYGNVYECGADHEKESDNEKPQKQTPVMLEQFKFKDYSNRIHIAVESENSRYSSEQIELGNRIHKILEYVRIPDDIDQAVERYVREEKVEADEQEGLKKQIRGIVENAECKKFFAPGCKVKTECTLVTDEGDMRPDRIVQSGDETWVVDYKTGNEETEHFGQVGKYCDIIRSMGYRNVTGYLLYINGIGCRVVEV